MGQKVCTYHVKGGSGKTLEVGWIQGVGKGWDVGQATICMVWSVPEEYTGWAMFVFDDVVITCAAP